MNKYRKHVSTICAVCGNTFTHRADYAAKLCSGVCRITWVVSRENSKRRTLEDQHSRLNQPPVAARWLAVSRYKRLFVFSLVDADAFDQVSGELWSQHRGYYPRSGGRVFLHRLLMACPEGSQIDHINRDPLDNRRENLRVVTWAQNAKNRSINSHSAQPFKGIERLDTCWRARITVDGRRLSLGCFATAEEAARAYDAAALTHHGEMAALNFPEIDP